MELNQQTNLRQPPVTTQIPRISVPPVASDEEIHYDGPLSGPMWQKVNALNSKLPNDFNWAIYDELYRKFGDQQPRGGVVFRTGLKLLNHHSSCSKCHYSFEIDTYGRGCLHNCTYCYALESLTGHGYWNRPHPFPVDMSEVRRIFHTVFETDKNSKWRQILSRRIPLRIGSMSDSFMKIDLKFGVTKELLRILSFYKYPYVIFTRSDLIARDEYLKLLKPDLASVQFSISGNDERLTRLIEPGAPAVSSRLTALRTLNDAGFWTTVRINPFFPTHPDGYFTDPDSVAQRFGSIDKAPVFPFFDWSLLDQIKEVGVPSFLVGVVRLSPQGLKGMSRVTGIDLKSFFKRDSIKGSYDVRYSDREVSYYYSKFRNEASRIGLRFNTCYIGMGIKDYFKYQPLWSNKSDCCDAKGNVPAITRSSQEISWSERMKHAPSRETAMDAMTEELGAKARYEEVGTTRNKHSVAVESPFAQW